MPPPPPGGGSHAPFFVAALAVIAYAGARLAFGGERAEGDTKTQPWWRPTR